jgi:hypothetical protein
MGPEAASEGDQTWIPRASRHCQVRSCAALAAEASKRRLPGSPGTTQCQPQLAAEAALLLLLRMRSHSIVCSSRAPRMRLDLLLTQRTFDHAFHS